MSEYHFPEFKEDIFDKIFPDGIFHRRASYMILHPWKILMEFGYEIKYAWQRVFRGWDDRVVWSVDWYLAKMIPEWLTKLKEVQHGIPCSVFVGDTWETTDEENEVAKQKWNEILDKIILGFHSLYVMQDEGIYPSNPRYEELEKQYNEGFDLFRQYFRDLWD